MARNRAADLVVQIVTDPGRADLEIAVVGDQVLDAAGQPVGAVPTVQADGSWAVEALPITEVAAVGDLDDQTGGVADGVLEALAAVGSPALLSGAAAQNDVNARIATINANVADLADKVNTILAALRSAGVIAE